MSLCKEANFAFKGETALVSFLYTDKSPFSDLHSPAAVFDEVLFYRELKQERCVYRFTRFYLAVAFADKNLFYDKTTQGKVIHRECSAAGSHDTEQKVQFHLHVFIRCQNNA